MSKKNLIGVFAIFAGIITFVLGMYLVVSSPQNIITWVRVTGALLVIFGLVSFLTAFMVFFDKDEDEEEDESI